MKKTDDKNTGDYQIGDASKVWLHHSLISLNQKLKGNLLLQKGDPLEIIVKLARSNGIDSIHWNRCYEPWQINRDQNIKKILEESGIKVISHNASLLWEPWNILKDDGTPYKIFTPFYRKSCLSNLTLRSPLC